MKATKKLWGILAKKLLGSACHSHSFISLSWQNVLCITCQLRISPLYIDLPEKAVAPLENAWKIPWTEEPGRLQSMRWLESDTFHALEKEMATHSSVLAWRIPGTGKPGGLPSLRSHRVGHDWSDFAAAAAAYWLISTALTANTFFWLNCRFFLDSYFVVGFAEFCLVMVFYYWPESTT